MTSRQAKTHHIKEWATIRSTSSEIAEAIFEVANYDEKLASLIWQQQGNAVNAIVCGAHITELSADTENVVLVSFSKSAYHALQSNNQVSLVEKAFMFDLPLCYDYRVPWWGPDEVTFVSLYNEGD